MHADSLHFSQSWRLWYLSWLIKNQTWNRIFFLSAKLGPIANDLDVWLIKSTHGNNVLVTVFNPVSTKNYAEILGDENPLYDVVVSLNFFFVYWQYTGCPTTFWITDKRLKIIQLCFLSTDVAYLGFCLRPKSSIGD